VLWKPVRRDDRVLSSGGSRPNLSRFLATVLLTVFRVIVARTFAAWPIEVPSINADTVMEVNRVKVPETDQEGAIQLATKILWRVKWCKMGLLKHVMYPVEEAAFASSRDMVLHED
jgi:hypothetical protein